MPNTNHEVYNNVNIATYTDDISSTNTFTNDEIDACILSAGVPNGFENRCAIDSAQNAEQVDSNISNPWYSTGGRYLEYDTSKLIPYDANSWQSFYHILYGKWDTTGHYALCTDMKIDNYRNVVTITPASATYYGQTFDYYRMTIQTQYGGGNSWSNSVLNPIIVIPTDTLRMGAYIGNNSYMHWSIPEMGAFPYRWTKGNYNTYVSLNNGDGGLVPLTVPCASGDAFKWTPSSETDVKIISDDHYNTCWYDVNYGGGGGFHAYCFQEYNNIDDLLMIAAICGLKFEYDGTTYKPLVSGGVVYGYTSDMTKKSEWDNWKTINDHTIPVTPPAPPAPPKPDANDNEIDVTMSAFTPSAGFVRYIEMTYDKLITLASSFNAYNSSIWNLGGDLMKNLISLKAFACSGIHSGTLRNIQIAGHEMTDGQGNPISGNYIDDLGVVDLGTIQVGSQFKFDDWRDYAPYTKIECFVPCCGWAQLPPWVMGRTVTGTLYIDLPNGSCKAVIMAGRTPVAEIGGCCAVDMPLSSVATGSKAAGIITSLANGAVSAFNPTPQNLISGSFGIMSAFNANFTETKGTMGDGSNINGCTEFLIKVTRPASTDTGNGEITARYKHEKGIPCAKTKTLAIDQGFTQIMDANIDGAMTDREKQMIIDGFRHGLIL